jgi:hypothetical protein
MDFNDIPQFPQAHYKVNVGWNYLESWLEEFSQYGELDLDPDYQRVHVWTPEQQTAYVEFILQGGESGRLLYWNHASWMRFKPGDKMELVDGKQRLEAVRAFLRDEVAAFGRVRSEFKGSIRLTGPDFEMKVAKLPTRAEVLRWYLAINAGGTPHTPEEIERVRGLLAEEEAKPAKPDPKCPICKCDGYHKMDCPERVRVTL